MWVKPAPGLKVRDPRTRAYIAEEGVQVSEHDPVFAKLLEWGDVVETDPPAETVAAPAPASVPDPAAVAADHPEA